MKNRRLALRSETLTTLTTAELVDVAGARDEQISLPVVGGCLDSMRLVCYVDTMQPTRCLCP